MYSEEDGGSAGYLAEPGLSHKDWLSGLEFSLPGPQKYVKQMAFMAVVMSSGLVCYLLWGFRVLGFGFRV